jgi:hemerythrin
MRGTDQAGVSGRVQLKWIDAFETGHAEIDALHRGLVEDCHSLLLLSESETAWPLVVAQAKKLVSACVAHFHLEEALLEEIQFPRRAEHAAEHRRFGREMDQIIDDMERTDGSRKECHGYPEMLVRLLIDFIIRHDLNYRSHVLQSQGL